MRCPSGSPQQRYFRLLRQIPRARRQGVLDLEPLSCLGAGMRRGPRRKPKTRSTKAKDTIKDFQPLVKDLDTQWKTPESPNVGHVVYSPPIDKGNKSNEHTMDWALSIEDQEFLRKRHRPRTGGYLSLEKVERQDPEPRTIRLSGRPSMGN